MYCIVDHQNKVNLFWSAKCGCTFVKNAYNYYILGKDVSENPHAGDIWFQEPVNGYTNIAVVRNPYKRLISGFYDKYVNSQYNTMFNFIPKSFKDFVNVMYDEFVIKNKNELVESHHFEPQITNMYSFDKVYDIEKINLEELLGNFPYKARQYNAIDYISRGPQITAPKISKHMSTNAAIVPYSELVRMKETNSLPVPGSMFRDPEIVHKVHMVYHNDFIILAQHGIDVSLPL